nr:preprouroguanylin [Anguilla japonica]CAC35448.1 guanylin precursor [Anguilla anguilla]CAQ64667.1 preprouroguanylin [Anguilla anguilla]
MREAVVLILLAFCFLQESQGVWVMDGDLSFPLEAVKVLKHLLGANTMSTPHPPNLGSHAVCSNPHLPAEFLPVCEREGASALFNRLVDIITPPDPCEICANAACTGCL